jgi:hypothetical protein
MHSGKSGGVGEWEHVSCFLYPFLYTFPVSFGVVASRASSLNELIRMVSMFVACVTHASRMRVMMCGDQVFCGYERRSLCGRTFREVRNEEETSTSDN